MASRESVEALFKGLQFDQEIIILCVRWYLRYKLSTRDLVEMMAERGVVLVHATISALGAALRARFRADNRISGDKVLSKGTRHVVNRAATALRIAATSLLRSRSYLGAQYRRLRSRLGAPKAITAMAHRLARLVYRMLKYGQEYVDKGMQYYEDRYRHQQIEALQKNAAKLGLQVLSVQPT